MWKASFLFAAFFCISVMLLAPVFAVSLTVTPDKDSYVVGEAVSLVGTAPPRTYITLQVYDPFTVRKAVAQIQADGSGLFSVENIYKFTEKDKFGLWKIVAYSQGQTAEATVKAEIPPHEGTILENLENKVLELESEIASLKAETTNLKNSEALANLENRVTSLEDKVVNFEDLMLDLKNEAAKTRGRPLVFGVIISMGAAVFYAISLSIKSRRKKGYTTPKYP